MTHIRSKQRVMDHGEVFTQEREVNAMLDLVKQETERIESRFLEPACGTGNFLVPVLDRKLSVVERRYGRSRADFERNAVIAVGSVYGIDLLPDNVAECRDNLFNLFDNMYTQRYKRRAQQACRDVIRFILTRNIVLGDARFMTTIGDSPEPIVFSEWTRTNSFIRRMDWQFEDLNNPDQPYVSDTGQLGFEPRKIRDYGAVYYLEVVKCWGSSTTTQTF